MLKIEKIFAAAWIICSVLGAPAFAGQAVNAASTQSGTAIRAQSGKGATARNGAAGTAAADEAQKVTLGNFVVDPSITVSEYYNDNIFYTRQNPVDDFITVVSPALSLHSRSKTKELNIQAGASLHRYAMHESENFNDFFAGFDGHVDVSPKTRLFGGAQYNILHEGRESPDAVLGTRPTEYALTDIFAGEQHRFDKFSVKLGATMLNYNFHDVPSSAGTINNDDRDRNEYEIGARIFRPLRKGLRLFLQGVVNARNYISAVDDFGFDRDSKGYGLTAGVQYNPTPKLSIEALAGGMSQHYADPALQDFSTPDFGALVSWQPSPLTNVNFNLDRRIQETTLPAASAYISTTAAFNIDRTLTKKFSLQDGVDFEENDYQGVSRTDHLIGFHTEGRYYLTPRLFSGLGYTFSHRDSTQAGQDYYDNRVMVRLGADLYPHEAPTGAEAGFGDRNSFYAGLEEGHGSLFTALDGPRGAGTQTADFGGHGGAGGVFAGVDRIFGNWFTGVEANAEQSEDFDWNHLHTGDRIFSVERGASYGLSLRGGYRQDNNVAYYARAGVLRTGFDTHYTTSSGKLFVRDQPENGFRMGGGIEAPLNGSSTFVRMDYTYSTYGDYGMTIPSGTDLFANSDAMLRLGLVVRSGMKSPTLVRHNFAGPYAGVQLGYGGFAAANSGPRNAGSFLTVDRAGHGGTGGLFAGYGIIPLGPFYLGAEGDLEASYAGWHIFRDPSGRIYSAAKDWTAEGALRAGYVFNDTVLLYGRAGGVVSHIDTDYNVGVQHINQRDNIPGVRYGGGIEVAATNSVFIRMDYTFTDYNSYKVNYTGGPDSFHPTETMLRAGVGYRF